MCIHGALAWPHINRASAQWSIVALERGQQWRMAPCAQVSLQSQVHARRLVMMCTRSPQQLATTFKSAAQQCLVVWSYESWCKKYHNKHTKNTHLLLFLDTFFVLLLSLLLSRCYIRHSFTQQDEIKQPTWMPTCRIVNQNIFELLSYLSYLPGVLWALEFAVLFCLFVFISPFGFLWLTLVQAPLAVIEAEMRCPYCHLVGQ